MRTLVLNLIGSVIIHSFNNAVYLVYLNFFKSIDRIKNFAWGASMLVFLQISLKNVKFEEVHSLPEAFLFFVGKDIV